MPNAKIDAENLRIRQVRLVAVNRPLATLRADCDRALGLVRCSRLDRATSRRAALETFDRLVTNDRPATLGRVSGLHAHEILGDRQYRSGEGWGRVAGQRVHVSRRAGLWEVLAILPSRDLGERVRFLGGTGVVVEPPRGHAAVEGLHYVAVDGTSDRRSTCGRQVIVVGDDELE